MFLWFSESIAICASSGLGVAPGRCQGAQKCKSAARELPWGILGLHQYYQIILIAIQQLLSSNSLEQWKSLSTNFVGFGGYLHYLAFPSTILPFSFLLSPTRRSYSWGTFRWMWTSPGWHAMQRMLLGEFCDLVSKISCKQYSDEWIVCLSLHAFKFSS